MLSVEPKGQKEIIVESADNPASRIKIGANLEKIQGLVSRSERISPAKWKVVLVHGTRNDLIRAIEGAGLKITSHSVIPEEGIDLDMDF